MNNKKPSRDNDSLRLAGGLLGATEDSKLQLGVSGCPAPSRLTGGQQLYDLFLFLLILLGGPLSHSPLNGDSSYHEAWQSCTLRRVWLHSGGKD